MAVSASVQLPTTTHLYEVLVRLHDDVRQTRYPYSAKVLKYGIISESEIQDALELDPNASEATLWRGLKPAEVAHRLAGGLTAYVDQEEIRERWVAQGLSEGSWQEYVKAYCMLKADETPFSSDAYLRSASMDNFLTLTRILDTEIFGQVSRHGKESLAVVFKTKWWKETHKIFADSVAEEVFRGLGLNDRLKNGPCHTAQWGKPIESTIRLMAQRWVQCPLWERKQTPVGQRDQDGTVDFKANNEANVKRYLEQNGFTNKYLEGRV